MKYAWIKQHREEFDASRCCYILSVESSSYYSWLANENIDKKEDKSAYWVKIAFEALDGNAGTRGIKSYLRDYQQIAGQSHENYIATRSPIISARKSSKDAARSRLILMLLFLSD